MYIFNYIKDIRAGKKGYFLVMLETAQQCATPLTRVIYRLKKVRIKMVRKQVRTDNATDEQIVEEASTRADARVAGNVAGSNAQSDSDQVDTDRSADTDNATPQCMLFR